MKEGVTYAIVHDITEKKKAEEELILQKEKAEKYLDLAGNIIVALNRKGEITLLNKKGYEILGYKEGTLIGKNWFDVCLPKKMVKQVKTVFASLMTGKGKFVEDYENPVLTSGGKERLISWHNTLLEGVPEKVRGVLSSGEDITEIRKLNEELEQRVKKRTAQLQKSYEELKTLDELKSNFLIITSHELKTPITPLMIQDQMLARGDLGPLTEKQKQGAQIIHKNMERLTRLINDILDVSKISSKVLKLQLKKKNINDRISEVISEKKPQADEKGVKINFVRGDLPEIKVDDFRFQQVMVNLLDNAVKFTPAGGKISVKAVGKEDHVLVSVADTGRGIKKANMEKLFNPFFQAKPSYIEKYRGGTGLGLAIVRGIVRQHGGKIWVKSIFGKGATFYFTLPINPPKGAENLNNTDTTETKEKKDKVQVKGKIPIKKGVK